MTQGRTNPKVDAYIHKARQWHGEYTALREIVLDGGLTEELKWGVPCYTFDKRNIVLIHGFKEYVALLFFKGALMQDPERILIQQTANVQAGRQIRFTGLQEITAMVPVLRAYILEAISVEQAGTRINRKRTADFPVAAEFRQKLDATPGLHAAFAALTPGRQRGYLLYFASAKQSATRTSRVEKCLPRIFEGKGLDD